MRDRASSTRCQRQNAFTLIELLIVVAIILILIAIALPNFLEAQTRAKVARAKTETAMLELSLEQYHLDQKAYPPNERDGYGLDDDLNRLTTPFVYTTRLPLDPFGLKRYRPAGRSTSYAYCLATQVVPSGLDLTPYGVRGRAYYFLQSLGPDLSDNISWGTHFPPLLTIYDPTNGTISPGDVWRVRQ